MRVARNSRYAFRSSAARWNSNRNSRFTGFELSCGKQAIKQFSNRNKNGFFGFSSPGAALHLESLRSYPFALSRKAVRRRPARMLPLEIAPRRLG
jgi:hypothetical protein